MGVLKNSCFGKVPTKNDDWCPHDCVNLQGLGFQATSPSTHSCKGPAGDLTATRCHAGKFDEASVILAKKLTGAFHAGNGWVAGVLGLSWNSYCGSFPHFRSEAPVRKWRFIKIENTPHSWMVYFIENPNLTWMRTRVHKWLRKHPTHQSILGALHDTVATIHVYGAFLKWGIPNSWLVYFTENTIFRWMIWWYPYFRTCSFGGFLK